MAVNFRQMFSEAERQQAIADALANQAMTPVQRPQGRVAANTGFADGLSQLASALASRRAGKQASSMTAEAEEARRKAQAAALSGLQNPPNLVERPETQSPYGRAQSLLQANVDPALVSHYLESQGPKKPVALSAGAQLIDPDTGDVLADNPAEPTGGNSRYGSPQIMESGRIAALDRATGRLQYTDTGEPIDPTDKASADLQLVTLPDGSTQVVNMRRDVGSGGPGRAETVVDPATALTGASSRKTAETTGQWLGEAYNNIQQAGLSASSSIRRLDRMDELLKNFETGRTAGLQKSLAEFGSEIGIDVAGLNEQQAFEALANAMALELRNPSGGAGMPGALSDKDREFLVSMVPRLRNTKGGNQLIIDSARRVAERDRQVAARARTYKREHGQLDEGFFDELERWSMENELFTDRTEQGGLQIGAVEEGYEYIGGDPSKETSWRKL